MADGWRPLGDAMEEAFGLPPDRLWEVALSPGDPMQIAEAQMQVIGLPVSVAADMLPADVLEALADTIQDEGEPIVRRALIVADRHALGAAAYWGPALVANAVVARGRIERAAIRDRTRSGQSGTAEHANETDLLAPDDLRQALEQQASSLLKAAVSAAVLMGHDLLDRALREAAADGQLRFRGVPADNRATVVGDDTAGAG